MFFWNKICGLLSILLICTIASYPQNKPEHSFLANSLFFIPTEHLIKRFHQPAHFPIIIERTTQYYSFTARSPIFIDTFANFDNPFLFTYPGFQSFITQSYSFVSYKKMDVTTIPADFSTCRYGFFCMEELKIEKTTGLSIRFRLGSLEQCNYYEGKP
jgi:hypothetical protein